MATVEQPISLRKIRSARDLAFLANDQKRTYPTSRSVNEYEEALPKFGGKTFYEHIEDRIARGGTNISVLDIGCGQGRMLRNLVGLLPNLSVHGLSAYDFRPEVPRSLQLDINRDVDYRIGDAQRLKSIFGNTKFDIVVSVATMAYIADPLTVLKQAYAQLNEGGILFLDKLTLLSIPEAAFLRNHLDRQRIKADLRFPPEEAIRDPRWYSLAIKRGPQSHLHVPFKYSSVVKLTQDELQRPDDGIDEIRLKYSVTGASTQRLDHSDSSSFSSSV